ncbi:barstar family protein [Streptomyces sp. NPDC059002]|uniref:barstar family protein n=1 Tax=Streptomyces sp. NPDC059002 TaxID=3346690 RepID=UPI0036A0E497
MQLPRYALAAYDPDQPAYDDIWALCADAEHLFADQLPGEQGGQGEQDEGEPGVPQGFEGFEGSPQELVEPPVRLLGCSPRGALRDALEAGGSDLGHGRVLRLGGMGQTLQHAVEGEVVAWIPSARGRGLVDLALDPWTVRPPRAAREVWDVWWRGRPAEPNLWTRYGTDGRAHWLGVARENGRRRVPDAGPGGTYHLDGSRVTDQPAFHCALGEAMNGPGGYFGHDLRSLADCLRGGCGALLPFTLVWHDAHIARTCLGVTPRTDHRPPSFEELLDFLAQRDIGVVLA